MIIPTSKYRLKIIISVLLVSVLIVGLTNIHAQQKGMITSIGNSTVRINWGTLDGLVQGVILNVYREDVRIHPATEEVLGTSEKLIGKIEVTSSEPNNSTARVVEFTNSFRLGDVVKVSFDDSRRLTNFAQELDKGTIQDVNNLIITFNMGRLDGVEPNLLFDIYRQEGASVHPVTGEPIDPVRFYIGRLQVTSTSDNFSMGQIIERERDVIIGDRVELSNLQAGDIAMETQPAAEMPAPVIPETTILPESQQMTFPDNMVGTVTRVSDRDLYFIWRGDYGFPAGRIFGLFRRIEIRHPETGFVIDNPLIQIGTATLRESIGKLGRATIATFDDDILPQDLVGLSEGETISSGQVITPENSQQVFEAQRSDILELARELANNTMQLQAEMRMVKADLDRLDRIDRDLAAQMALTQQTFESINEIKMMLRREGYSVEGFDLPLSRASVERTEIPGSGIRSLRLNYTDDITVNFQLAGNNILVTLEVDSLGNIAGMRQTQSIPGQDIIGMDSTQQAEGPITGPGTSLESGEPEEVESTPFYKSIFGIATMIVVLFGVLGALYFFVLKKKKSVDKAGGDDMDAGGKSTDDDFGGEEVEEGEEIEELAPDEEEIESFEEESL